MEYTMLKDLNREALEDLFFSCPKLREIALEDARDCASFWLREQLDTLTMSGKNRIQIFRDYEINYGYGPSYVELNADHPDDVLWGLEEAQKAFCFLTDEDFTLAQRWCAAQGRWNDQWGSDDEKWEAWLDETQEHLEEAILDVLLAEYRSYEDEQNLFNYFFEFMIDARDVGEYFMREDGEVYEFHPAVPAQYKAI